MSETKWTKGPWAISADMRPGMEWNNHIVSAPNPILTVCFMTHDGTFDNEQGEANANLIAAAPELYDALLEIFGQVNGLEGRQYKWIRDRAGDVLAKARGEK